MDNLFVFDDVKLIGKDNDNVFLPHSTKYYMFVVDDLSEYDGFKDFPFEKEIRYFKEDKHKTGFLFDDYHITKCSVIGFASYNIRRKKTQTKYLVYLGLFANQKGEEILAFVGNNGVPFESEAEVFTFRQKNMSELYDCTKLITKNKDGEIVEEWALCRKPCNLAKAIAKL